MFVFKMNKKRKFTANENSFGVANVLWQVFGDLTFACDTYQMFVDIFECVWILHTECRCTIMSKACIHTIYMTTNIVQIGNFIQIPKPYTNWMGFALKFVILAKMEINKNVFFEFNVVEELNVYVQYIIYVVAMLIKWVPRFLCIGNHILGGINYNCDGS